MVNDRRPYFPADLLANSYIRTSDWGAKTGIKACLHPIETWEVKLVFRLLAGLAGSLPEITTYR